ncbi:MAG: helix-turn-helix transcriptional regulator [Sandaracinus sp.]|nr:helix-turn-helix transcriptional regulator [Sandaracinus sp.]MCB9613455.1 helix-turn-helix transcriptional regulator [Sandaracinus sp.]
MPQLARSVGVSRAVLARRFAERGMTPIGALTRLRLEHAAELVLEDDVTFAEVADRVGYRSELAFNRGWPPGAFDAGRRRGSRLEPEGADQLRFAANA